MLEYSPEYVTDDVWHRVVQVVTGFQSSGDTGSIQLQTFAAHRAYDTLQMAYVHENAVKLSSYLLGEFGHMISDTTPASKQFDAIVCHYSRETDTTKALMLLAVVKMYHSDETIHIKVIELLKLNKTSIDVELQTRCHEMTSLCHLSDDVRDTVLALMPPFAEGVQLNNPLIQRMKVQAKGRGTSRLHLEEVAKTEKGLLRPSHASQGRGGDETIELGPSRKAQDKSGGSSDGKTSGDSDDDHDDNKGKDDDGDDDDDEDSEEDNPTLPPPRCLSSASGKDVSSLWRYLCVSDAGCLFLSSSLCLNLKQQYLGANGRLAIQFVNKSAPGTCKVEVQSVEVQEVKAFRCKATPPPHTLEGGEQHVVQVDVQCLLPFLNPPKVDLSLFFYPLLCLVQQISLYRGHVCQWQS
eukprot:GHVR01171203.1.p1 GENE.GHVR01171203.1~~GHVR01171203.1.p1  ORF type:complete len:422 (+),score=115.00 GHVR01171203.1:40-1266(+)